MMALVVTGEENVTHTLAAIAEALDATFILDQSAALLLNRIRDRFLRTMDETGKKWKPSFASYLRRKEGRGGDTLYDTGRMFHSIQVYADGPLGRMLGTDVEYAPKHQFGLEGMVVRRFIGVNEEDIGLVQAFIYKRVFHALGS